MTFTKTKNGEDRAVRLTKRAQRVLKERGPKASGPVFTFHGKEAKEEVKHCPGTVLENAHGTNGYTLDTVVRNPTLDKLSLKRRKPPVSQRSSMVGATGIEPATPDV